jgi:hypothetical protein
MRTAAAGILAFLVLTVASGAPSGAAQPSSSLLIGLTFERGAFRPGEPVAFTIRVQNIAAAPVTMAFATTQRFDVIVESEAIEIDRWSRVQTFTTARETLRWAPGEVKVFNGAWLPRSRLLPGVIGGSEEQPVTRGVFRAHAVLTAIGMRPSSRTEFFVVGEPIAAPAGCSTLPELLADDLPVPILARTVEPPEALISIWQPLAIRSGYAAYAPVLAPVSDLEILSQRSPLTVCLRSPATITLP